MGAHATVWDRNEGRSETKGVGPSERFGGVRADFVATLGRRVVELRAAIAKLGEDASSSARRDDLRRRVHALAAAARLLRFNKLAEELAGSEALVDRIAERGKLTDEDSKQLYALLDRVPELAWGEAALVDPDSIPKSQSASSRPPPVASPPAPAPETFVAAPRKLDAPQTILIVGPAPLAEGLVTEADASPFEVERTEDYAAAADLARALAPDVMIIDADKPGAREVVASLLADPLTEELPILLLGRFVRPEDAALYAALGVARTLPKPVSPTALRRAIIEVSASYVKREIARAPLGEVTLDELGKRLAEELRRGLCDAADERSRQTRISFGEGSEMLAALWGAVARMRDLVTIQSRGTVRFVQTGPEGALPFAPWLGDSSPRGDKPGRVRALGEARGSKVLSLDKMSIVVADDDAAVTWFLADVLRQAGATVYEARDGDRAFELACEHSPDLVISDIVMPGLDGFALCRAIKRDFALRDVPVVLLSWKEDLLQRVRELGAGADGYMRKEASATAIVQRLREILGPRLRVAERLSHGGEVRGRLEGLTPRTLLSLACTHLPASTLTVRDALYLYEVEIRDGRPVRATRTTADGSYERGPGVLARLLGVGSGRFVVVPIAGDDLERLSAARPDLFGTLAEQLVSPIASARAAQRLLSGGSLMQATRIEVDLGMLGPLVEAMPNNARSVLRSVAGGLSPREIVMSGSAPARLVEDVLCDAAAHGAISAIVGSSGSDLLTPAVQTESERLRGIRRLVPVNVPLLSDVLPEPASPTPQPVSAVIDRSATPGPVVVRDEPSPSVPIVLTNLVKNASEDVPRETLRTPDKPAVLVALNDDDDDDATTMALLDRSPVSNVGAQKVSPDDFTPDVISGVQTYMPPPVAPITPEKVSEPAKQSTAATPPPMRRPPLPAMAPSSKPAPSAKVDAAAKPERLPEPLPSPKPASVKTSASPKPSNVKKSLSPKPSAVAKKAPAAMTLGSLEPPPVEELPPPRAILPSSHAPRPRFTEPELLSGSPVMEPPKRDNGRMRVGAWILFALAGVVFAVGSRVSHQRSMAAQAAMAPAPVEAAAETAATAAPETVVEGPAPAPQTPANLDRKEGDTADFPILPQDSPLRKEDKVPKGQGLLEVIAGATDSIFIDGQLIGTGPVVKAPLAPKREPYEIRVRLRGEERVRFAIVKEGRLSRLRIAPPWSR